MPNAPEAVDGAGKVGQAKLLQQRAGQRNVKLVVVSIGGVDGASLFASEMPLARSSRRAFFADSKSGNKPPTMRASVAAEALEDAGSPVTQEGGDNMTKKGAKRKLNRLADELTNENYHTEASVVWAAVKMIDDILERTVILVPGFDEVVKIVVTP